MYQDAVLSTSWSTAVASRVSSGFGTLQRPATGAPSPLVPLRSQHRSSAAAMVAGALSMTSVVRRKKHSPCQLCAKPKARSKRAAPSSRKQTADPEVLRERKELVKELALQVPEGQGWLMNAAFYLQIEDAVSELEELNAVSFAADSGDLEGEWKVLFSSSAGLNAGTFGLLNGEARQVIRTKQRQLINTSYFWNGLLKAEWITSWKAQGPLNMVVGREDWYPIIFGFRIGLLSASTDGIVNWKCTYTDQDFRIFRASKDTDNNQSSIFVLERV